MNNKLLLWIFTAIFALGTFMDIMDGYLPKLISSVSMTLALLCFALAAGKSGSKLNTVGYTFLFVALLGFIYRLVKFYHVF
ncbi:hypothetical protein CNR22_21390 [Sphingobacteriaceae bacterium]|nr:hypothetical protein CNR22_21390 [Sphingobacteriaceae bacterium]